MVHDGSLESGLEAAIEDLIGISFSAFEGDERVKEVFIFAGLGGLTVFNPYFRIGNEICTLTSLDKTLGRAERTIPEIEQLQFAGLVCAGDLSKLFARSSQQRPYELRVVYHCAAGSVDYALYYNPPKIGSGQTSSRHWLESLRAGEDPLPAEEG